MYDHAVSFLTEAVEARTTEIDRLEASLTHHRAQGNDKVVRSLEDTVTRLKTKRKSLNAALTLIRA